jgi:hypothetical protein
MPMQFGDTFVMGVGGHLWIVVSDPAKHSGHFVIANLTKDEYRTGKECELNKGDHGWIACKCFVNFGGAREVTPTEVAKITALMGSGHITPHLPMSHAILQKITTAAKTSKALKTGLKKYF